MTARASSPPPEPPPSVGVRLPWEQVPGPLRAAVEQHLGGRVVSAVTQSGGFSPGPAVRLRLDSGRRVFAKIVGPELNPESPDIFRAEARIAAALPASVPAPAFLGCIDSGGWVALMFEDIEGAMPAQPWRPDELARVLVAMTDLARSLTPTPVDALAAGELHGTTFRGWRELADAARAGDDDLAGLDPWARARLDRLADLEAGWAAAAAGRTLAHSDVRADNILLTSHRVVFVDWPWACLATPWFDLVMMAPSIRMQGGPPPREILAGHPVSLGADPAAVTAVVAALAGFLVRQSRQPPPPGLPTLRAFQAAQGRVALDWLRERTSW
jgi:aminoglycoside phosphotransferase (APT) family kinase protein